MPVKLYSLLKIQSFKDSYADMHSYIFKCIKETANTSYEQDRVGNIYVTKGTDVKFPAFVCHTDTGAPIIEGFEPLRLRRNFWMGARIKDDDELHHTPIGAAKAGIYVCLKMLLELPNVKLVFYVNGHKGQVGATNSSISFFDDCRWAIQCDRKGNADIVTRARGTELASADFASALEEIGKKFKFKPDFGQDTDIVALKEDLKLPISVANLSAGFWAADSPTEHIVEGHLQNTIFYCKAIATKLTQAYPHRHLSYADKPITRPIGQFKCGRVGCPVLIPNFEDRICLTCTDMLRKKGIKCKHCQSTKLFTSKQLYYEICYDCNLVFKKY